MGCGASQAVNPEQASPVGESGGAAQQSPSTRIPKPGASEGAESAADASAVAAVPGGLALPKRPSKRMGSAEASPQESNAQPSPAGTPTRFNFGIPPNNGAFDNPPSPKAAAATTEPAPEDPKDDGVQIETKQEGGITFWRKANVPGAEWRVRMPNGTPPEPELSSSELGGEPVNQYKNLLAPPKEDAWSIGPARVGSAMVVGTEDPQAMLDEDPAVTTPEGARFEVQRWKRFYHWHKDNHEDLLAKFWEVMDATTNASIYCVTYRDQDLMLAPYQAQNVIHGFGCRLGDEDPSRLPIFGLLHILADYDSQKYKILGMFVFEGQDVAPVIKEMNDFEDYEWHRAPAQDPAARVFLNSLLTCNTPTQAGPFQIVYTYEL